MTGLDDIVAIRPHRRFRSIDDLWLNYPDLDRRFLTVASKQANRLQQHWKAVLATFFPRWKAGARWRCTSRGSRGQAHGHCDVGRRIIEIFCVSEDDDALDMLLIHEISHAVASLGHGKTWQRRLTLAAVTARKLGRTSLADLLETEIDNYQNRGEGLPEIYAEVQDALLYNPDLTRTQIKRWLAQTYGLRFSEVGKVFRGLGTVYEKGRQEGLEFRHDREEARKEWQDR